MASTPSLHPNLVVPLLVGAAVGAAFAALLGPQLPALGPSSGTRFWQPRRPLCWGQQVGVV